MCGTFCIIWQLYERGRWAISRNCKVGSKGGKYREAPVIGNVDLVIWKSPVGDRYLLLSEYEINLFQTVKRINEEAGYSDGDFIFCDKVGRTKICEIDNCIRAQCTRAGIEVKSAHDICRTVAFEMDRRGVPIEDIRWYLGHNDIATTQTYILNNQDKEKTSKTIVNALSDMNGLDVLVGTQNF